MADVILYMKFIDVASDKELCEKLFGYSFDRIRTQWAKKELLNGVRVPYLVINSEKHGKLVLKREHFNLMDEYIEGRIKCFIWNF